MILSERLAQPAYDWRRPTERRVRLADDVRNSISCIHLKAPCDKGTMACATSAISTGVQGYVTAWLRVVDRHSTLVKLHSIYVLT